MIIMIMMIIMILIIMIIIMIIMIIMIMIMIGAARLPGGVVGEGGDAGTRRVALRYVTLLGLGWRRRHPGQ